MIPLQHTACTVIKLHGDYQQANLINTDAELAEYDPAWLALLRTVLAEYGLFTIGWSGQSDTVLRREIEAAAGQRYGCFLGIRGEPIPEVQTLVAERRAAIVPVTTADEFFDKLTGTLTEIAQRPAAPLQTSAVVGATKRLISQGRLKIELRDVLLREAGLLKDRLRSAAAVQPRPVPSVARRHPTMGPAPGWRLDRPAASTPQSIGGCGSTYFGSWQPSHSHSAAPCGSKARHCADCQPQCCCMPGSWAPGAPMTLP